MWPFSLGPPVGSPLHKGLVVRVVETGGCDGGIRRSVKEGKVVGFINAADKWPDSNFDKKDPFSIFAAIQTDTKKAFLSQLSGHHEYNVDDSGMMYYPASRNYWCKYEDGVWEYLI